MTLDSQLKHGSPAIIAILRGVRPDEVLDIGHALVDAGIRMIEVPLNSPEPLQSIERLVAALGGRALIGAGTVLSVTAVDAVAAAGGRLVVSPNTDPSVISRALERGLDPLPGAMTPTEAFAAIGAGTRHLKLFPGSAIGPAHLRALREVLPTDCRVWAVGGTNASNLSQWIAAGAVGIGIGSSLYRSGMSVDDVHARAVALVASWRTITAEGAAVIHQ